MDHEIGVRRATEDDAPGIARAHVDTWHHAYRDILPGEVIAAHSYERRERMWQQALSQPNAAHHILVAEDESGEIAGFASGGPERTGDPEYRGELYAIYVRPEQQGRGVGRALTEALVRHLVDAGFDSMLLWVLSDNLASRRFYEALGGKAVRARRERFGEVELEETGYGWKDLRTWGKD